MTAMAASAPQPFDLLPSPLPPNTPYASATAGLQMGHDMSLLHNMVIRGFNSIILQAPYVLPGTPAAADILDFTQILVTFLHHHHDVEEDFFFPELEKLIKQEGLMSQCTEEHRAFDQGLESLLQYAQNTNHVDYSPEKLESLIKALGVPLVKHLAAEIPSLVSLDGRANNKDLIKVWHAASEYAKKKHSDPTTFLPVAMGCADITFPRAKEGSIVFPFFLYYLTSFIFQKKHAGAWRFLPADLWGKPQPMTFLPKELGGLGVTA
jgi:Hemerythrin HHE cation binding domain